MFQFRLVAGQLFRSRGVRSVTFPQGDLELRLPYWFCFEICLKGGLNFSGISFVALIDQSCTWIVQFYALQRVCVTRRRKIAVWAVYVCAYVFTDVSIDRSLKYKVCFVVSVPRKSLCIYVLLYADITKPCYAYSILPQQMYEAYTWCVVYMCFPIHSLDRIVLDCSRCLSRRSWCLLLLLFGRSSVCRLQLLVCGGFIVIRTALYHYVSLDGRVLSSAIV